MDVEGTEKHTPGRCVLDTHINKQTILHGALDEAANVKRTFLFRKVI